jgi:hypothetical protein
MVTPYCPEAHGMVERGHKEIKDALTKMCRENGKKWKEYLPLVKFADWISTKRTTGYSPYELQFGQVAVLPVDHELGSFLTVDWSTIKTTAELLEARVEQLLARKDMMDEALAKIKASRNQSVRYWDKRLAHRLRKPLMPGELVLVYNKALETQWGNLFKHKWNGPYRIVEQVKKGPYILAELDGTILARSFAANHIKKFYPRGETEEEEGTGNEDEEDDSEEEEEEEEDNEEEDDEDGASEDNE